MNNLLHFFILPALLLFANCAPVKFHGEPIVNHNWDLHKKVDLTDTEEKQWHLLDYEKDTIPGMSVIRAYKELIKDQRRKAVIVAIIDSGTDIEHELLNDVIWVNEDEIPHNGIDDDQNGYVDDIHGWNFLGDASRENLEYVRLQKKTDPRDSLYQKYEDMRLSAIENAKRQKFNLEHLLEQFKSSDSILRIAIGKPNYTLEEVREASLNSMKISMAYNFMLFLKGNHLSEPKLKYYLRDTAVQIEAHNNLAFEGRSIVGDDPDDIADVNYGNANVIGPDKESAFHGTHVSGIVAAMSTNARGVRGVAQNAKIMVLRAVPEGDEYDKDIALAIRYAVDNGAKIINTSFGKSHSAHPEWVQEALRYAAEKDVLVIRAAGNNGSNIDYGNSTFYFSDEIEGREIVDNVLTVGATTSVYSANQLAPYSNYGVENVDVFAPGSAIYSTTPSNTYEFFDGTSMAAPNASGVAAVLRSFFPKLSAPKIKTILMSSGVPLYNSLTLSDGESVSPKSISKTGRLINLYNALIYASKLKRIKSVKH